MECHFAGEVTPNTGSGGGPSWKSKVELCKKLIREFETLSARQQDPHKWHDRMYGNPQFDEKLYEARPYDCPEHIGPQCVV